MGVSILDISEVIKEKLVYLIIIFLLVKFFQNFKIINRVKPSYPDNERDVTFLNNSLEHEITMREFINSNIPEFKQNAWSLMNPFLFHGHLQTMFAGIRRFRRCDILYFRRIMRYATDGGVTALDEVISEEDYNKFKNNEDSIPIGQPQKIDSNTRYMNKKEMDDFNKGSEDDKPIALVLTGLSGSSAESYCRCLFSRLSKSNFQCFVLNSRGCGNVELSTPYLFCALWTEDVRQTIKMFKLKYPNRKIYLIGFSLGAVILNNYLSQEGEDSEVVLGISLASIWDLRGSSYYLESGLISSTFYSTAMTFPLLLLLEKHKEKLIENPTFAKNYNKEIIQKIWKLKHFDDYFTSQMFGFTCADDYYAHASPIYRIRNIKTPVININSLDDPITGGMEIGALPLKQARFNPFITMINTTLGGHVGWFKWNNVRWYADPLSDFLVKFNEKIVSKAGFRINFKHKKFPKHPLNGDDKLPVKVKIN